MDSAVLSILVWYSGRISGRLRSARTPAALADGHKARVRVVHASPDAPAVDIAVPGGPVLVANVPFKGTGDYLPIDAGTYDLEARLAGTDTVALSVPGVTLEDGTVYTIFAMGLAGGETTNLWMMVAFGAGLALIAGSLVLRNRQAQITTDK